MNHVQRRLASTAAKLASVSPSALASFPPVESFKTKKDEFINKDEFNPESWAAIQPVPSTALSAFAHRTGLASVLSSPEVVRQACTHPSFLPLYRQHYPQLPEPKTNAQFAALGNSLMGLFATEFIQAKYPYLPTRVLKAAVSAHVGPMTASSVAQEMGAQPLLRWHRTPKTPTSSAVLLPDALASIPRSLAAIIYQEQSLPHAREFVHAYFLNRQVDLRAMLKFVNPKKALLELVRKFGRESPKSRLLKETGRFSNSPVFVVGIFSGADQIGEGFGASLRMAEFRAAEDALLRVYLTRTPDHQLQLPSSTFTSRSGSIFTPSADAMEGAYTAPELVVPEVMYMSSGRSSIPSFGGV